jgi:hypothetical protein
VTSYYPEIRKNDTITRLDRLTEAEYARLEFQQTVFCAGEHLTIEPIKFGRAFEEPPFFTFAGVVRSNAVGGIASDFRFIDPGPDNSEIGAMEAYWEIAADGTTGPFVWLNEQLGEAGHPEVYAWTSGYTAESATSVEVIDWTYELDHPSSDISVPVGGQDGDHLILLVNRDTAWQFTTGAYPGFTRNYWKADSVGDPRSIAGFIRRVTNWTGEPTFYTWVDDTHGAPMHVLMILVRGLVNSPYNGTSVNDITVHDALEEFDSFSRFSSKGDLTIRAAFSSEHNPVFTAKDATAPAAFFIGHLTVGVAEWIQDPQGMYIGANLWYKMTSESIRL